MKTNCKKVIVLGLAATALLLNKGAMAQQDPMNTQYTQNPLTINPGYAGSNDALSLVLLNRMQWTGIDGAPKTTSFSVHSPIKDKNIGVGLNVVNDKIGKTNQTGFFADFSYKLKMGAMSSLRLGLRAGGSIYSNRLSDYNIVQDGDAAFSQNISGEFLPNVGFGAYFTDEKYFAGFSVPRLLNNDISFNNGVQTTRAFKEAQHVFLIAGGLFNLSPSVKAKPSIGFRYVKNAPVSLDLTANFLVAEKIWLGAFCRIKDSFGAIMQLQVSEQFRFGYSYDYSTSPLQGYNSGSHEIMLSYDFIYRRANIKSPRYF